MKEQTIKAHYWTTAYPEGREAFETFVTDNGEFFGARYAGKRQLNNNIEKFTYKLNPADIIADDKFVNEICAEEARKSGEWVKSLLGKEA